MKVTISKWGNSMALRLPKSVLEENKLVEGSNVDVISRDGLIIIEPKKKAVREGWEQAAKEAHKKGDDKLMMDFSNQFDKEEWTW